MKKKVTPAKKAVEDSQALPREEVMKQPGWSNTGPGSPQTTPLKRSELAPQQIAKATD
jgi:hypothetical protein